MMNRTGERYGYLVAIAPTCKILSSGRRMPAWRLRCDCGNEIVAMTTNLSKGHHRSCGCKTAEMRGHTRHRAGDTKLPEYSVYHQMRQRCYLQSAPNYKYYGARGIAVCDRWRLGENGKTGFQCFIENMGRRPAPDLTIDRIDNDGNYEPGNCRWANRRHQGRNKKGNVIAEIDGHRASLAEWAERSGLPYHAIWRRKRRLGWLDEHLLKPLLLLLLLLPAALPAAADGWYEGIRDAENSPCCGIRDCSPLDLGRLRVGDDGFEVDLTGGGLWSSVPESKVVRDRSPDGRPHLCIGHDNGVPFSRCLILPPLV